MSHGVEEHPERGPGLVLVLAGTERQDRCHTMRGIDITDLMSPAHQLFDAHQRAGVVTVGIGDGGNEIGMGNVPLAVVAAAGWAAAQEATRRRTVRFIRGWRWRMDGVGGSAPV